MILVYTESWEGKFKKSTYEAVSYAAALGKLMNCPVTAVSIGNVSAVDLAALGKYGAAKVLSATNGDSAFQPQDWTALLSEIVKQVTPKAIVMSHTYTGKALAPRLAANLRAGLVTGVVAVPSSVSPLTVRKKCFSNKGFTDVVVNSDRAIIAITPNSYKIETGSNVATVETFSSSSAAQQALSVKEVKKASGKVALTEAEIVVSGGRGLKGPENWGMVEELAALLGAATACSKPVADIGWRPHHEHVGQTGITIGPDLYVAIGISGAIQHLAGVSSSKVIVVINSDKEAPFFKAADYGIVGDAFEVVPRLIAAVKKFKSTN